MLIFVVFECLQVMTIALLIINDILKKMPGLLYPKGEEKKKRKKIKVNLLLLIHW